MPRLKIDWFHRSLQGLIRHAARAPVAAGARGFATEKQIAMRITATSNLKKVSELASRDN